MEVPTRYQVECGMVTLPEDHSSPSSPSIQLAVAIVHSSGDTPAPDPLLFINGGPGARTLDSISLWLETFSLGSLLTQRDIIFFDQRGTGYSQPALVCSESPSANPLVALQDAVSLTACRDRLAKSGINLGAYTSVQNAGDISVLREALGYDRWNLYGVSYGTRIALTVLRDHPEGVRSVVLDAITPIEAHLLTEDPVYAKRALHHLFATCRSDPVCRIAYPDVEGVYDELVDELARNPISLEITNQKTGQTKVEKVNGAMLNGTVLGMLGSPEAAGIPGLIYELQAGNYAPIIADLEATWEAEEAALEKPAPVGAQLTMICGEEAPFVTYEEMARALATYPPETNFLTIIDSTFYTACQVWGLGPAERIENTPVNAPVGGDIPVLILAGEYDTARPLDEARRAAQALANSTVVEFPGAGHAVALAGTCPLGMMAQFLDDPTTTLDTRCTARMGAPHFFITISLTRPLARVAAVLAGIVGLVVAAYGGIGLGRLAARRRIPWRVTLRRVGWLPLVISALATAALYWTWPVGGLDYFYQRSLAQVAVMVGPLVVAIQTAFFFASEDEPALEVTLACPRPFHWLPIERTAVALLGQTLIATTTVVIGAWGLGEQLPIAQPLALLWWLSSALLLSGLAAFTSTRSRRAMVGVLLALLTWLVLGAASSNQFDDVLLPPVPLGFHFDWPRPLDVIQPFLWSIHPFLHPGSVSAGDFILNRIIVGGLGLVLMALAAKKLADPERVLMGTAGHSSRAVPRGLSQDRRSRRKPLTAFARIKDVRMAQLWTIVRYEMLTSWRRGSLRAILISILLFPQLFHIIACLFGSMLDEALIASLADRPEVLLMAGTNATLVSNTTTIIMIILMLPLMVAEIIPLDRQHRVREVIDALPIAKGLYITGKLLSVWPVILIGLCISAVLNGLVSWILNGPFQIETVALFWLTGLIPLALFGSQMGVMFAAGQPDRRRAIRTGLLAVVVTLAASFALPVSQFFGAGVFQLGLAMTEIDNPRVIAAIPNFPNMLSLNIWLRIGGVVLAMATVWLCTVRLSQHRHTTRSQEALQ
jgi:pimeloyl-ACP methyl ester carboxylesterase